MYYRKTLKIHSVEQIHTHNSINFIHFTASTPLLTHVTTCYIDAKNFRGDSVGTGAPSKVLGGDPPTFRGVSRFGGSCWGWPPTR